MQRPPARMVPGVAGTFWYSPAWKSQDEHLPRHSPILSIIKLRLQEGLDVQDVSQPVGKLWSATLEYISTIPGHTWLCWGLESGSLDSHQVISLLIQWESAMYWSKFQNSIGVSLMLLFLAENPFNRCIRTSLMPLGTPAPRLKIVTAAFDSHSTLESRELFKVNWIKLTTDLTAKGPTVYGDWIEQDGAVHTRKGPIEVVEELKATQPYTFCGLVSSQQFESLGNTAEEFAIKYVGSYQEQEFSLVTSLEIPATINLSEPPIATSIASLLQLQPVRKYTENNGLHWNLDMTLRQSIVAVNRNERRFPGPWGSYVRNGEMNEYTDPETIYPALTILKNLSTKDHSITADFVLLNFRPNCFDANGVNKDFEEFRSNIRELEGCEGLRWGHFEENADEVALFVYWTSASTRSTALQSLNTLVEHLLSTAQILNSLPRFNPCNNAPSTRGSKLYLEFIKFTLSTDAQTKTTFEAFYKDFQLTTVVRNGVVMRTACIYSTGLWLADAHALQAEKSRFVGLMGWESKAAMLEFLGDFARQSGEYERLGHKIDSLRLMCNDPATVTSKFVQLKREMRRRSTTRRD